MTETKDDGGAAFGTQSITQNVQTHKVEGGITVRDYFAAAALQGFCANHKALKENVDHWKKFIEDDLGEIPRDMLAHTCYQLADSMMKTRQSD